MSTDTALPKPVLGGLDQQEDAPHKPEIHPVAGPGIDPLQLPDGVDPRAISWKVVIFFSVIHLLAVPVVLPWLFTWSGVVAFLVSFYLFGCLGININYHRLLTHRSFKSPRWFERLLTLFAFCSIEGSSIKWVAAHRMHHKHSDHRPDPHSPWVDFFWGHLGWMLVKHPAVDDEEQHKRYAGDLYKDPFHVWMDAHNRWLWVAAFAAIVTGLLGAAWGYYVVEGGQEAAIRYGLSWLVWGAFFRTVWVWHVTWAINSVTHLWGYQSYKSNDQSRNNWLFGIIAFGEGWHNNHHADQRSASNWHRWWEFDLSFVTIKMFQMLGLARDLVTPERNKGTAHDPSLR